MSYYLIIYELLCTSCQNGTDSIITSIITLVLKKIIIREKENISSSPCWRRWKCPASSRCLGAQQLLLLSHCSCSSSCESLLTVSTCLNDLLQTISDTRTLCCRPNVDSVDKCNVMNIQQGLGWTWWTNRMFLHPKIHPTAQNPNIQVMLQMNNNNY